MTKCILSGGKVCADLTSLLVLLSKDYKVREINLSLINPQLAWTLIS